MINDDITVEKPIDDYYAELDRRLQGLKGQLGTEAEWMPSTYEKYMTSGQTQVAGSLQRNVREYYNDLKLLRADTQVGARAACCGRAGGQRVAGRVGSSRVAPPAAWMGCVGERQAELEQERVSAVGRSARLSREACVRPRPITPPHHPAPSPPPPPGAAPNRPPPPLSPPTDLKLAQPRPRSSGAIFTSSVCHQSWYRLNWASLPSSSCLTCLSPVHCRSRGSTQVVGCFNTRTVGAGRSNGQG